MRIAIIAEVYLPKVDGVVHRTLHLIRELKRRGDEVVVICPHADGTRTGPAPVVEFRSFPFPLYPEYRIGRPDDRLVGTLDHFAPDVLHYVNPFAFGFSCHDLLRKAGVQPPSVFSFHTLYGEFAKQYMLLKPLSGLFWWLMREYHNRADINLTVSSITRDDLIRRGFERVHLWPPAIDTDLFNPSRHSPSMRARLAGGHTSCQVLLTVSRLAPEKNIGFLANILEHFPDASIAVVGDGPSRPMLERRFAGKRATFLGYLKGIELAEAYASADAFVYASETETMGNVVLEAMASGCALVAPRAGGIPSLVTHGETGLLYAPGDLANAIGQTRLALTDQGHRQALGRRARQHVESWSWPRSIESVCRAYHQAIDEWKGSRAALTLNHRVAQAVTVSLLSGIESLSRSRAAVQA
jgi:glycosyltransferase involved in cell wall biosynthesis